VTIGERACGAEENDRGTTVPRGKRNVLIEASGQHGTRPKSKCWRPSLIGGAFIQNFVTHTKSNVHQAGGRLRLAIRRVENR